MPAAKTKKTKTDSTKTAKSDLAKKASSDKKAKSGKKTKSESTKKSAKKTKEESKARGDSVNHLVISETNDPRSRWFVVHTYSGHEAKIAQTLLQRVETMNLTDKIHEILIPTQDKIHIKSGQKSTVKEQIFPGYMLIKMFLDDQAWLCVRTTQGVTSFIGAGNKPTPLSEKEVEGIQKFVKQAAPKFKTSFSVGEAVKITDGPFTDFLGQVDTIDEAKGKVMVLVSIFGRETPVELDFLQIAKV